MIKKSVALSDHKQHNAALKMCLCFPLGIFFVIKSVSKGRTLNHRLTVKMHPTNMTSTLTLNSIMLSICFTLLFISIYLLLIHLMFQHLFN